MVSSGSSFNESGSGSGLMQLQQQQLCESPFLVKMRKATEFLRERPFTLLDYDWIGFDLDHTLMEYNIPMVEEVVFRAALRDLIEKKYIPPGGLLLGRWKMHSAKSVKSRSSPFSFPS